MEEKVIIKLEYGSDWQRDLYGNMVYNMLLVLKDHMLSSHKKNKCDVNFLKDNIQDG